jgi:hypothetical protein
VAEEFRQRADRLAIGVDPEAVLVLENLDVELLNDVVGLGERLQAGVLAVQEATGVALSRDINLFALRGHELLRREPVAPDRLEP